MTRGSLCMLAVILLAACGGGGGKELTRQEYASRADAICKKFDQQQKAVGTPTDVRGVESAVDKVLPTFDKARGELHDLKPPKEERTTATQWLDSLDVLRSDLVELRDKAHDNDLSGVTTTALRAQEHNKRANALATGLGMKVCSKN